MQCLVVCFPFQSKRDSQDGSRVLFLDQGEEKCHTSHSWDLKEPPAAILTAFPSGKRPVDASEQKHSILFLLQNETENYPICRGCFVRMLTD